jgi:hypothetical protein
MTKTKAKVTKAVKARTSGLRQVLAYANLACTPKVIACLTYPCSPESWHSLKERGRLIHRASLFRWRAVGAVMAHGGTYGRRG